MRYSFYLASDVNQKMFVAIGAQGEQHMAKFLARVAGKANAGKNRPKRY